MVPRRQRAKPRGKVTPKCGLVRDGRATVFYQLLTPSTTLVTRRTDVLQLVAVFDPAISSYTSRLATRLPTLRPSLICLTAKLASLGRKSDVLLAALHKSGIRTAAIGDALLHEVFSGVGVEVAERCTSVSGDDWEHYQKRQRATSDRGAVHVLEQSAASPFVRGCPCPGTHG